MCSCRGTDNVVNQSMLDCTSSHSLTICDSSSNMSSTVNCTQSCRLFATQNIMALQVTKKWVESLGGMLPWSRVQNKTMHKFLLALRSCRIVEKGESSDILLKRLQVLGHPSDFR